MIMWIKKRCGDHESGMDVDRWLRIAFNYKTTGRIIRRRVGGETEGNSDKDYYL
jgi:hypothetical protein